jgi:hypothetical protein
VILSNCAEKKTASIDGKIERDPHDLLLLNSRRSIKVAYWPQGSNRGTNHNIY